MAFQPRDASGKFINRQTWELAYRLAGERVPSRIGSRNSRAPLTRGEVERAARKHRRVAPAKVAKPKAKAKGRKKAKTPKRTVRQADTAFPRGTEFELTANYKSRGKQNLHIKIRVVLSSAMTADQARTLLDRGMEAGRMPPGIQVESLDWSRGQKAGDYTAPGRKVLRDFYGAISGADRAATRFERVESDGEYEERDEDEDEDDGDDY